MATTSDLIRLLSEWQTLIGSFLGAFVPLVITGLAFALRHAYSKRETRRLATRTFIQDLNFALTELISMRTNIDLFSARLSAILVQHWPTDKHMLARTNFPNVIPHPLDKAILRTATVLRSAYLITQAQDLYSKTSEAWSFFGSLKEDYNRNLDMHQALLVTEHVLKGDANLVYRDGLEAMQRVMRNPILSNNIPTLIRILVKTRIAASTYAKHPYWWRWYREKGKMRFFLTRSDHQKYQELYYERIESLIEEKIDKEVAIIETEYKKDIQVQLSNQGLSAPH